MILTIPNTCDILTLHSGSGIFITKTRALSNRRKPNRSLSADERSPFYLEVGMTDRKEYMKKYQKEWWENIGKETKRKRYLQSNNWNKANREKCYLRNKEFCMRNPEKIKKWRIEKANKFLFGGNRIKVLERDNYTCKKCGKTHHETKLCVHHIDGMGKGAEIKNNKMSNLITLCYHCHGKIHGGVKKCAK
jgi:hypothetical protein